MVERPGNEIDPLDEFDDAIINADDTGLVRTEHDIAEADILLKEDELSSPGGDEEGEEG